MFRATSFCCVYIYSRGTFCCLLSLQPVCERSVKHQSVIRRLWFYTQQYSSSCFTVFFKTHWIINRISRCFNVVFFIALGLKCITFLLLLVIFFGNASPFHECSVPLLSSIIQLEGREKCQMMQDVCTAAVVSTTAPLTA